jgi:hypothetical protein
MVRLLKFKELWTSGNGTEHESDLFINEDSIDSIETINDQMLQIHTKAGVKYKVSADKALKVIENYVVKENDGVA